MDITKMNTYEIDIGRLTPVRYDGTAEEELDQAIQRRLTH
jgi:hypothetical protein